jgi:hypothetical protein
MPKARSRRKVGRGKILSWIKGAAAKVDGFLKKTKILSKISSNFTGNPYGLAANTALNAIGYGRRRVGGNLNGHGLKRAGCGRRGRGLTRSGMGRILI